MKKMLLILFVLFSWTTAFGQYTWYKNPMSMEFALVNEDIDLVHTTFATCDSATIAFSQHATGGEWEIIMYDEAGVVVFKIDTIGRALIPFRELDPVPDSDHDYDGNVVSLTVGENVALPDVLYMKSDGKLWKADADAAATMPGFFIAVATISADASGDIMVLGWPLRDDTWTWTVGGLIYVSATAGAMTQTAPAGVGDQVQVIGIATHADRMIVFPSPVLVEVTS